MKKRTTVISTGPLAPHYVRRGYRQRNGTQRKKISFDLHGVIDANCPFFRTLMNDLIRQGWEVHIVTGAPWIKERETLRKLRIPFTHFFSIVDYHVSIGTKIRWDRKGNAHIDPWQWDRTKGLYCHGQNIDMHFDDSDQYVYFFKTPYTRYSSRCTPRIKKLHL